MKTSLLAFSALALSASLYAANTGFKSSTLIAMAPVARPVVAGDNQGQGSSVPPTGAQVEALFVEAQTTIENSLPQNHPDFAALGDRMTLGINDQIKTWRADGYTVPLEGDEQVSRSLLDYTQKLSALNASDKATWKSVKSDTLSSLHHLQGAYGDLRTDSAK